MRNRVVSCLATAVQQESDAKRWVWNLHLKYLERCVCSVDRHLFENLFVKGKKE